MTPMEKSTLKWFEEGTEKKKKVNLCSELL